MSPRVRSLVIVVCAAALAYCGEGKAIFNVDVLSFLGGVGAWLMGAGAGWLVAAVLIGAVVPFTLIGIMPTNHRLSAPDRDLASFETRVLLDRWGNLHAVRTMLSILATVIYLWLLVQA